MAYRQRLGRWGESLAAEYLSKLGYLILERNARTAYGELDLVAIQSDILVFVEVKTRTGTSLAPPEAGVTRLKKKHLLAAAQAYLQLHPQLPENYRIDVIAIRGKVGGPQPEIVHFENALDG